MILRKGKFDRQTVPDALNSNKNYFSFVECILLSQLIWSKTNPNKVRPQFFFYQNWGFKQPTTGNHLEKNQRSKIYLEAKK